MKDKEDIEFLSLDDDSNTLSQEKENKKDIKKEEKPHSRVSRYENLLEDDDSKKKKKDKKKKNKDEEEKQDIDENDDMKRSKKKKRKLKKGLGQTIFCLISFLFMMGCFVFYGTRAVHYYKIYNPKGSDREPLATSIMKNASIVYDGAGVYKEAGTYIYKGKDVNNYLSYSGLLWRIVKISNDNSVEIVLDSPINALAFDNSTSSFNDSDISAYLNKEFVKYLDTDKLDKAIVCTDQISDVSKLSCDDSTIDNYVKLPDISDFLNSVVDDTYMSDENTSLWLYNKKSKSEVWYSSGYNISSDKVSSIYAVKPVVTLKSNNVLVGGKGTKKEPYKIEKDDNKIKLGSYVTLGEDTWIVYKEEKDTLRLTLAELDTSVKTRRFSSSSNIYDTSDTTSLASYLNTYYYEDISYKDMLIKSSWYTGEYKTSYKDIYNSKTEAYVGMLNLADFKFGSFSDYYYLTTPTSDNMVYIYSNGLFESDVTSYEYYRPAIVIKNKQTIKSGSGTESDPYVLEVK